MFPASEKIHLCICTVNSGVTTVIATIEMLWGSSALLWGPPGHFGVAQDPIVNPFVTLDVGLSKKKIR